MLGISVVKCCEGWVNFVLELCLLMLFIVVGGYYCDVFGMIDGEVIVWKNYVISDWMFFGEFLLIWVNGDWILIDWEDLSLVFSYVWLLVCCCI